VGFASYAQFRGGVGYRHTMEHTIILGPAARGRGLGRALMTAIEDHARAGGTHSLFAGVSAGNPEGRAFHAAMGFAETAVLPQVGYKFGRWLDLVLMQKFLS
jgi:phosphinothricin acetyltransferase